MQPSEFTYEVETARPAAQALVAVIKAAHASGWVVVGDYELSGLVTEGESGWDLKTVDICLPELARPFVSAQPLTALCMPCSILIFCDGTRTKLSVMRPGVLLPHLFADAAAGAAGVAERIDRELWQILEKAKG